MKPHSFEEAHGLTLAELEEDAGFRIYPKLAHVDLFEVPAELHPGDLVAVKMAFWCPAPGCEAPHRDLVMMASTSSS